MRAVTERIFFNEDPYKNRVCPFLLLTVRIAAGNMSLVGSQVAFIFEFRIYLSSFYNKD